MKVAYIAGPYRAGSDDAKWQNIMYAREVARYYWINGYAVICPHLNSMFMDGGGIAEEDFLAGDEELLRRCDVLVLIPGWEKSDGARAERNLAKGLGKEIIIHQ